MAQIKPFRALRFTSQAGEIRTLVSPPYDIVSEKERARLLEQNPYNIIRLELPRGGDTPYADAAAYLQKWQEEGILAQDQTDSLYLYEEEFCDKDGTAKKIRGFITLVRLEEFSKKIILPHEQTLSKAKADRFDLMCHTFCNFSQIYSLYLDDKREIVPHIDALARRPADVCFTDDEGITQRLWQVDDAGVIAQITAAMAQKQLFIADGHHRYETALHFRDTLKQQGLIADDQHPANYVMMMLVDLDHDGLVVWPTHRMLHQLAHFDPCEALSHMSERFDIEEKPLAGGIERALAGAAGAHVLGFYPGGTKWYQLTLKAALPLPDKLAQKSAVIRDLDVSILHDLILEPTFAIDEEKLRTQSHITYTRSEQEALTQVQNGAYQCSFFLNPTKVSQIKDVSLANEKMPQKSTYFYPKIITGLVMNKIMDIPAAAVKRDESGD